MFIKLNVVDINLRADDPKEIMTIEEYITFNSDCIERYNQCGVGYKKEGKMLAEYTHIVLKDGCSIDVAERKVDIDALLNAHEVIKL